MMAKATRKQFFEKFGKHTHELAKLMRLYTDSSIAAEERKQLREQIMGELNRTSELIAQTTAEYDKAEGKMPD